MASQKAELDAWLIQQPEWHRAKQEARDAIMSLMTQENDDPERPQLFLAEAHRRLATYKKTVAALDETIALLEVRFLKRS